MDILDILLSASFWAAAIRIASPLIFATLGELICERAGCAEPRDRGDHGRGAHSPAGSQSGPGSRFGGGVAVAMLTGMAFGLLHATLSVPFGLSQHVVGIGLTLLATSLTFYTYRVVLPEVSSPPKIEAFQPYEIPLLADLPLIGPALFSQTPLTYAAFLLAAIFAYTLYRTPVGLAVRAAGENPSAVAAQGLSVTAIRMGAVITGSGFMAVGGAFLTLSAFDSFFFDMVNGRGWICIALVVFGAWRPGKAVLGAILFAAFDALQIRLQQTGIGALVPYQLFLMLPYILSILALVVMSRRAEVPAALMVPFNKGER